MIHPTLKEGFTEWEIIINQDLKFIRTEIWKHGIKRYWGYDKNSKTQKLMFVQYPKKTFSRKDMERILPKYNKCKLCKVGKKFIKGKNNTTTTMVNYSIVDLFGKIPKIGNSITRNRYMTQPIIMQFLSTITRYPIAIVFKPLGKSLVSLFVGIVGEVGVHYLMKNDLIKGEWADFFANYISSSIEMKGKSSSLSLGAKEDLKKLVRSVKAGNFAGVSDSLLNKMPMIRKAIKGYGASFKNAFTNSTRRGRLRTTENTLPIGKIVGKKLFPDNLGRKKNMNYADDFKYTDTSKRFRTTSEFGSGFRTKRRFKVSSDRLYAMT